MSYYDDPEKLTYDEAHSLVEQYLREYEKRRTRVTGKDVAVAYEVEETQHNLIRICDALDQRLEVVRESGAKATQYRIP